MYLSELPLGFTNMGSEMLIYRVIEVESGFFDFGHFVDKLHMLENGMELILNYTLISNHH